jgi:hypothetical protein
MGILMQLNLKKYISGEVFRSYWIDPRRKASPFLPALKGRVSWRS